MFIYFPHENTVMTTQTDNVTTDENAPATAADVTTADPTATAEVDGSNGAPAQEDDAAKKYAESSREAKYLAESKKVISDNTYLLHLVKHNRPMAERIARDDFKTTLDEAVSKINAYLQENGGGEGSQSDSANPPSTKSEFDNWYAEKEADKTFSDTVKELGLEEGSDKYEQVIAEYSFLMDGKRKSPENVKRLLKAAYKTTVSEAAKSVKNTKEALAPAVDSGGKPGEKPSEKKPVAETRGKGPESWY